MKRRLSLLLSLEWDEAEAACLPYNDRFGGIYKKIRSKY